MVRIFMNQTLIDNVRILWIRIIQANKEQSYRFKKEWIQNNIITTSKVIQIVSKYISICFKELPFTAWKHEERNRRRKKYLL
jgi:hypothetical protein